VVGGLRRRHRLRQIPLARHAQGRLGGLEHAFQSLDFSLLFELPLGQR